MSSDALYSCFYVDAKGPAGTGEYRLFSYGPAQPVLGTYPTKVATAAHTNLPRSGDFGLPMHWTANVSTWRASTNIRFAEPVLDWAAECSTTFRYNDKVIRQAPLLELLMCRQSVVSSAGELQPIREHVSYGVTVLSSISAVEKLQSWLVEHTNDGKLICWIWLEGIVSRDRLL